MSIIIPTLDEAQNVGGVLSDIVRLNNYFDELRVVDGGSEDDTVEICQKYNPLIFTQLGTGKGNAIKMGVQKSKNEFVLIIDGDGSHNPKEIPLLFQALSEGADVVKGSRFLHEGNTYDMSHIRRIGNQFFLLLANLLFKANYTDICYGYMAFKKEVFDKLEISETGFAIDAEIFIKAKKRGIQIVEVPSIELPRKSGKSNLRIIPDGLRILYVIIREALRW